MTEYVAISLAVLKAYDMNIISNNNTDGVLAKPFSLRIHWTCSFSINYYGNV